MDDQIGEFNYEFRVTAEYFPILTTIEVELFLFKDLNG